MLLDPLIGHISSLIVQIEDLRFEVDQIPYSSIKKLLNFAIDNYKNGLAIIRDGLTKVIIRNAQNIVEVAEKQGRPTTLEQVIYSSYQSLLQTSYTTAERFSTEITMLVRGGIPPEIYHWLLEIPKYFRVQNSILFREGSSFISETFDGRIIDPLEHLISLANETTAVGSIEKVESVDLVRDNPVRSGHLISCIRGEAQTPILWPVLCHEMFETVDKEIGLFGHLEKFVFNESMSFPTLDENPKVNKYWITEIFMDLLAISFFGPTYALSLLEYFRRSPYYPTESHPDAPSRLFVLYQYLGSSVSIKSDILAQCHQRAWKRMQDEIDKYERGGQLDKEKEERLSLLHSMLTKFFQTFRVPLFLDIIKEHDRQTASDRWILEELLKSEQAFIPFHDPAMSFNDIQSNVLDHHISLAFHPNIILNVVLSDYELYRKADHLDVIVDSIKKWKIKQTWESSADALESL